MTGRYGNVIVEYLIVIIKKNKRISQRCRNYSGVIELEYQEGEFKSLRYWKSDNDLYNEPFIEETTEPFK